MKNIIITLSIVLSYVGADFNFGECSGSGTFEQQIVQYNSDYESTSTVGIIPAGIKGLRISLTSDKDVDIRLYGENNDKIVHWPYGLLSKSFAETKTYQDIPVSYSGYNGVDGNKGHEYIEINGTTPTEMTMKAFGYKAGYATVNYSWTGKVGCTQSPSGNGSFTQALAHDTISLVGTIPPHVNNVQINLNSDKDLDIQLYAEDGTAIVSWKPQGLLSGDMVQSIIYHDMNITWSGYNGIGAHKGHESIKIEGNTTEVLVMKVYGYEAGSAEVTYSWGDENQTLKRIFILGSSTVHAEWYRSATFNDPYGENRVLEGWGEELTQYAKDPSKVYNRARSGSHSIRYRSPDDSRQGRVDRHWDNTEALIVDTNDSHGGFLLIQFGAAEAYSGVSVEDFKTELRAYVSDAQRLGLTPVLISPIGARSHSANTRPYAQYVEAVASETGTLFLDLYSKSKAVWQTYEMSENGHLTQADKYFSYIQRDNGINNTHLGRIGAKEVAGWVKELACASEYNDGVALCKQFLEAPLVHEMTMREDAEDADTQYWETYDTTTNATVSNVYDTQKRSNVIVLQGDAGLDNGFRYSRENLWDVEDEPVISWEMNYSDAFTFFVTVDTEDGYKTFEYQPNDTAPQIVSGRYRFGLGSDANDGTWHTFVRDLEKDLQTLDPTKHILMVHRIAIRGSGRVDNIKTMKSVDTLSHDIAPTIAVLGEAEITVNKDSNYIDAGVTVVDDIDTNLEAELVTTGTVDTSTVGTYTLYYRVHDSAGNGGYAKRVVHVVDEAEEEVVIHEDAEDGQTTGWNTYATTDGSTINNVIDNGNHVIELQGNNGLNNGFSFSSLNITEGFVASWRLKYSNDFRFFVQVRSVNSPDNNIYMEYTPDAVSRGLNGSFIHHGLGTDAKDGSWHTFTRDIEADFNVVYPDDSITRIVGFSIRGSGRIDDISTSTRTVAQTFTYNGHNYKIVKNALSWQDASTEAHADGGYLANISSIAENHEIYSRLYRYIAKDMYENTVASNGGGASYVWLGGNDIAQEDTWVWENNSISFWQGRANGNSVGEMYSNWGRNTHNNEVQREPDNASNQDALGMALTQWQVGSGTLGQASQWNDLIATDALYSIVEYDNPDIIVLDTLKAFPTAEGAGAMASGGRGGNVIYVTNRNSSGEGSLKAALETEGTRTVVFAIGGRFDLNAGINLGTIRGDANENTYSHFTLAGQTAVDKGGVHLANNGDTSEWARHFNIAGQENMILRYFDTRFNWQWYTKDNASDQQPSIRFVNSSDFIVDHMSSGWSAYGLIVTNSFRGTYDRTVDNITVQNSLFHENIINPNATAQKNHNIGLLLGVVGEGGSIEDWNKVGHFSIHRNAFIGVSHRFPNTAGGDAAKFDIINNYVHGFDGGGHKRLVRAGGNAHNDFRKNVYQETLYSPTFSPDNLIGFQYGDFIPDGFDPESETPNFYIDKNLFLSNDENRLDITDTIQASGGRDMLHVWTPTEKSDFPNLIVRDIPNSTSDIPVSIMNAELVKEKVLNNVGANVRFDSEGTTSIDNSIDAMYIGWAKNNNAPATITVQVGDGGMGDQARFVHPTYSNDTVVDLDSYDTDRDGMPNTWELTHNLNPEVANNNAIRTDRNWQIGNYTVINNAGYSDLEMYLADVAGDFHMLAHEQ